MRPLGALNIFIGQIFALDSDVVKAQLLFSLYGGFLNYIMYHNREQIIVKQLNMSDDMSFQTM